MENQVKRGKIFVVSAPSGAGKTTILKRIINEIPNLYFAVSVTTRKPRPGEVDGVDYHFVSVEDVLEMFRKKELMEWAMVHGNFYGTPVREIEDKINGVFDDYIKKPFTIEEISIKMKKYLSEKSSS